MAKGTKEKNEWDTIAEGQISDVGQNISRVIEAMGVSQAHFAKCMNVATGTLSSYINGTSMPTFDFIAKMCVVPEIQKAISFTADELMFERLEFNDGNKEIAGASANQHSDMVGNYFMYFFDQSSQNSAGQINSGRKLRYGIISIYEQVKKLGEIGVYAYAIFFKDADEAESCWSRLKEAESEKMTSDVLREFYRKSIEHYTGELEFQGSHVFICMSSAYYKDKGLIVLNAPEKKPNSDYIGGLGNVLSISHGSTHCPVAQKVIFSRIPLENVSEEELGSYMGITGKAVDTYEETEEIMKLFRSLFPGGAAIGALDTWFDEQDKKAIFNNRLSRLLQNRAEKVYNSMCVLTKDDDHRVYKLIKRCMDAQLKQSLGGRAEPW